MPDCALTLVNIVGGNDLRGTVPVPKVIRLRKAYTVTVRTVDPKRTPVSGARVAVVEIGSAGWTPSVRLNYAFADIATPALTAISGTDGHATIPGLDKANSHMGLSLEIAGMATVDGAILAGDGGTNSNLEERREIPVRDVYLAATAPLTGTVVNSATGLPIAGVKFEFIPRPGAYNRKSLYLMSR